MKLRTCSMRLSAVAAQMYSHIDMISPHGTTNNPCTRCGSYQLWRVRLVFDTVDGQRVVNFCCDCLGELIPNGVGLIYAGKVNERYKYKKFESKLSCVLCGDDPRGGFWVSKYEKTSKQMVCTKCIFKHIV